MITRQQSILPLRRVLVSIILLCLLVASNGANGQSDTTTSSAMSASSTTATGIATTTEPAAATPATTTSFVTTAPPVTTPIPLFPSLVDPVIEWENGTDPKTDYLTPTMKAYRALLTREVEYDEDVNDDWADQRWVYSEFDLLFDVFSENRVQTYIQLLADATGFPATRIVPLRSTVGSRGLAYGTQTLFSVKLVGALGRQSEVTLPPGYVPPTATTTTIPVTTRRTTTPRSTTALPTSAPTTTDFVTTDDGNSSNASIAIITSDGETTTAVPSLETTTDVSTTDVSTTDVSTTTEVTTTVATTTTTTRPTTTTAEPTTTLSTTRAPRTLAPQPVATTGAPTTGRGGTTEAPTTHPTTTGTPETPVPETPRERRDSDAYIFVNAVRRELANRRSPLSLQRLASIRKAYAVPRTVETIYNGVSYLWVAFVVVSVLILAGSIYLVIRNRSTQEQDTTEYSPAEDTKKSEFDQLNHDDLGENRRNLRRRMQLMHKEKLDHAKAEGDAMPLTRGHLRREQMRRYKETQREAEEAARLNFDDEDEREADAIKAAYHDPHFTSVAAAFAAMDAETGEYTSAEARKSKAEVSEAARLAKLEAEERKRTERLPLIQMLSHDHQFALPYSPLENAERKARWLRELRQNDARNGRSFAKKKKPAEDGGAGGAAGEVGHNDSLIDPDGDDIDDLLGLDKLREDEMSDDEEQKLRKAALRQEAEREAALEAEIANRISAAGGLTKERQELLKEALATDPLKTALWKKALQPGVYQYRKRDQLELFDKTKVERAFEEDVRKGGWKKPTNHRMFAAGMGDYDLEGNFIINDPVPDPPLPEGYEYDREGNIRNIAAEAKKREEAERLKQEKLATASGGKGAAAGGTRARGSSMLGSKAASSASLKQLPTAGRARRGSSNYGDDDLFEMDAILPPLPPPTSGGGRNGRTGGGGNASRRAPSDIVHLSDLSEDSSQAMSPVRLEGDGSPDGSPLGASARARGKGGSAARYENSPDNATEKHIDFSAKETYVSSASDEGDEDDKSFEL